MTDEEASRALEEAKRLAGDALSNFGKQAGRAGDALARFVLSEAKAANLSAEQKRRMSEAAARERNAGTEAERQRARRDQQEIRDELLRQGTGVAATLGNIAERLMVISLRFSQGTDPFMDALRAIEDQMNLGKDAIVGLTGSAGGASTALESSIKGTLIGALAKLGDGALAAGTLLIDQYRNIVSSFRDITRTGITLGSMFEMAAMASEAGFGNTKQFAAALEAAQPHLEKLGMAGGRAASLLAKTFGDLRADGGELGQQLTALGYGMNEQSELIAIAMAQNRAAGLSQNNLTQDTIGLAKNMRLLSELTGKDAKRLTEEARQASLRGRVIASLDAAQLGAYQEAMKGSNKVFSDALTEVVSPLGDIVTPELAYIANSVSGFREGLDEMKNLIQSGAKADVIVAKRMEIEARLNKATTEAFRENPMLAAAGMLGSTSGVVKGINERMDSMAASIVAQQEDITGAQDRIAKNMDKVSRSLDPLLDSYTKTSEAAIKAQNEINVLISKPVQAVAGGLEFLTKSLSEAASKINDFTKDLPNITKYRELPRGPGTEDPDTRRARDIVEQLERLRRQTPPTPRAAGGSILPNKTYLVGERGPELLVSRETGTVINNDKVTEMAGSGITAEERNFYNDMRSLMREQVLLLRNHISVSQELNTTMESLETIQSRIAGAAT